MKLSGYVSADGCETNSHKELDLGELLEIPCPCHEYLWMLSDLMDQKAWRVCGGSYTNGSQLLDTDFSQCTTVTDQITSSLCHAAMVRYAQFTNPKQSVNLIL